MNMAEKSDFQFFFKLLHALYYCPSNITWAVDTSLAAQKLLDLSPLCCFKERMVFFVFFCLSKGFFLFFSLSYRMPERMSEKMSESMSDSLPENM